MEVSRTPPFCFRRIKKMTNGWMPVALLLLRRQRSEGSWFEASRGK
jgi:hypothetical protein